MANFPGLLEWNYGLNQQGTSVDLLDQQFREQQMSEAYSVTMLMIGIAAGALVDKWLTGPASAPLGGGEDPLNLGEAPGAGSGKAQTGGAGNVGKILWDSWQNYEKVTANGQEYAKVGNKLYWRDAAHPEPEHAPLGEFPRGAFCCTGRLGEIPPRPLYLSLKTPSCLCDTG